MNQQTVSEDKKKELLILHQQWAAHPVTRELLDIVRKQQRTITDRLAVRSMDETVSDATFRNLSVQLRTLITMEALITNSETFTNNIK